MTKNKDVLEKARSFQESNIKVNADGYADTVLTSGSAGVELYSIAGSQRSSAKKARKAQNIVDQGKREGKIAFDEPVTKEVLEELDIEADEAMRLAYSYSASVGSRCPFHLAYACASS